MVHLLSSYVRGVEYIRCIHKRQHIAFPMSKYARRIDENQNEIVKALRDCGAYVRIISQGDGIPDLLVGYMGYTILMEIKDGDKVPSHRKLTEAEQKFFDGWTGGMLAVVNNVAEALDILKCCK